MPNSRFLFTFILFMNQLIFSGLFEAEEKKNLDEILIRLPLEERTIIELYFYQNLSISQISLHLNCSTNIVKRKLRFGIRFFQDQLNPSRYDKAKKILYANLPNRISY